MFLDELREEIGIEIAVADVMNTEVLKGIENLRPVAICRIGIVDVSDDAGHIDEVLRNGRLLRLG